MPVLSAQGYLMISPSNTAPSLTDPTSTDFGGPFYMRTAYNDKVQGAAVAKFACEVLKVKTAATIHDGSPYAQQLQQVFADQFKSQCGGTITAQEAIHVGDKDFHPVLTTIGAAKPEALFFPIFDPEAPLIVQQSRDIPGLANTKLISADGAKDDTFITSAGPLAQSLGMYFSGPDLELRVDLHRQVPTRVQADRRQGPDLGLSRPRVRRGEHHLRRDRAREPDGFRAATSTSRAPRSGTTPAASRTSRASPAR